ncbi:MAG TPA: hypothetical protein VNI34_06280 [Candidatus Nitrosotalea sp.]|nr:hypothetical protein [Candidatus Nitrosotalea sp.]
MPFDSDGELQIVRDLRNFFLHTSLPGLTAKLVGGADIRESSAVDLSTASLLAWDGWRPEARAVLRAAGDGIGLAPLVSRYLQAAVDLHRVVIDAIEAEEHVPLSEYRKLAEEHDAIVGVFRIGMQRAQLTRNPEAASE